MQSSKTCTFWTVQVLSNLHYILRYCRGSFRRYTTDSVSPRRDMLTQTILHDQGPNRDAAFIVGYVNLFRYRR